MRRRVLEPESQDSFGGITGIKVDIPTENGVTYTFISGDKDNTVIQGLRDSDFPFRFEPTPPNYFTSVYLSIHSESSYTDPGSLNGKSIDIYYYCKDSSIFTGWELDYMTINGNTVREDDTDFPHIYTINGDGYYKFEIRLPVGFSNKNIMRFYMRFHLIVEDSLSSRIYISL